MLTACPLETDLVAFAGGAASEDARRRISSHLDRCDECRQVVAELARIEDGAADAGETFSRGEAIGRYLVLDRIGAGAMGVVYAAYDPDLGRRVAIKVLLPGGATGPMTQRLLREAQAMARLSHPNVVRVYDVGTTDAGRVFVTMEFVEGKTLKAFLADGPRPWHEALAVCRLAGAGLAAANRELLVHRDFKPENILVADDGRVLVTDFGLVHAVDGPEETASGALLGTPAYMAPERFDGAPADARSDQYAFAVTVYEALYGVRPFPGDTLQELRAAVRAGRMRETPRVRGTPARVHRALARALSVDPAARYSSTDALLQDLGASRPWGRKLQVVLLSCGVLAVAATLATSVAMRVHDGRVLACSEGDPKLAATWNPEVKARLHRAFSASRHAYAEDAWRGVESALDRYATEVRMEQSETCRLGLAESTRARSDEPLRLRRSCLDERVEELGALTRLFEKADEALLVQAVRGAQSLSRVESCRNDALLRGSGRRADDAVRYPRSVETRARLASARAHHNAGAYALALTDAEDATAKARADGSNALLADALTLKGMTEDSLGRADAAERTLDEAVKTADLGGNDLVRADALISLGWLIGYRRARYDEGLRYLDYAGAALERMGDNDELQAKRWGITAAIDNARMRPQAALEPGERALRLAEKIFGGESRRAASALNTLAGTYYELGRFDDAFHAWDRTRAIQERILGPHHPDLASTLLNLGGIAEAQGRPAEARADLERAAAISEETTGLGDEVAARILASLAEIDARDGHPERALEHAERARLVAEKLQGSDNPAILPKLVAVGAAARSLRRFPQAREALERAVALAKLPDTDPRYHSAAELLLAETLADLGVEGERSRALALDARVVAERGGAISADDRASADAWLRAHGVR